MPRPKSLEYRPTPEVATILNEALAFVNSVDYEVPLRWVFYQLVQNRGLPKNAYSRIKGWLSKARKAFWNGWTPDTLTDDTRAIVTRDDGYETPGDWARALLKEQCLLKIRSRQENVVLVLFEAAAMSSQFDHYLGPLRVSTMPFRGDPSIPSKSQIAKRIASIHRKFPEKPVRILYFGDYDPKGLSIPISALKDIWQWMEPTKLGLGDTLMRDEEDPNRWSTPDHKFEWIRVGINEEQVHELDIPENPEKPGTYQWEALSDDQARAMILEAVIRYWDPAVVEKIQKDEEKASKKWKAKVGPMVDRIYPESRQKKSDRKKLLKLLSKVAPDYKLQKE